MSDASPQKPTQHLSLVIHETLQMVQQLVFRERKFKMGRYLQFRYGLKMEAGQAGGKDAADGNASPPLRTRMAGPTPRGGTATMKWHQAGLWK